MIHTTLALLALFSPIRDGQTWLNQAEEKLYRWPKPSVVVRFEAETDVLKPMIAAMKADIAKNPDAEAKRFVAAIERAKVRGTIDTGSGEMTAEVDVDYKSSDERAKTALAEIKRRVAMTVTGVFEDLPLHDPSILKPGLKVTGCTEAGDSVEVTVQGQRAGETMTVRLSRSTALPESIETPAFTGSFQFSEVSPRRFIPTRFDLVIRGGPETHAEYAYQEVGELRFPSNVKVTSAKQSATIRFHSVVVEPHTP